MTDRRNGVETHHTYYTLFTDTLSDRLGSDFREACKETFADKSSPERCCFYLKYFQADRRNKPRLHQVPQLCRNSERPVSIPPMSGAGSGTGVESFTTAQLLSSTPKTLITETLEAVEWSMCEPAAIGVTIQNVIVTDQRPRILRPPQYGLDNPIQRFSAVFLLNRENSVGGNLRIFYHDEYEGIRDACVQLPLTSYQEAYIFDRRKANYELSKIRVADKTLPGRFQVLVIDLFGLCNRD